MMSLETLNNNSEFFKIAHISEEYDISSFSCKKGPGLEQYLKSFALDDERCYTSRTYLIISKISNEVVAYFSLRTGLITISRGWFHGFDAYPGIELANFAVNDNYKEREDAIKHFGVYVFTVFILPLVQDISKYVGSTFLFIYALPEDKLLNHYSTMGFSRMSARMSKFIYRHVKPNYDRGCIFMYQNIELDNGDSEEQLI